MKFKVGDRVKFTDTNPPFTGNKGVVIKTNQSRDRVTVRFDGDIYIAYGRRTFVCLSRSLTLCHPLGMVNALNSFNMVTDKLS